MLWVCGVGVIIMCHEVTTICPFLQGNEDIKDEIAEMVSEDSDIPLKKKRPVMTMVADEEEKKLNILR